MLLLDKEMLNPDGLGSARTITVVSTREALRLYVAQLLRTRGLENVELLSVDFMENPDAVPISPAATSGVIIDISGETDVAKIGEYVRSVVPQNVWCCLIGDSDSISLSQKFVNEGLLYFHTDSQLPVMVERILSGVEIPSVRNTVKIMVLGCKGGIGTSFISAHVAHGIAFDQQVPVLLAQGSRGSQDLDIMFDKKIGNDIAEVNDNLHLYRGDPNNLPSIDANKYNFILFDQPIHNLNKDEFSGLFEQCTNFVLIVDRRISSLRVAKNFLDECDRIRIQGGPPIRTFICISDHAQENSKLMAGADVERLLKCDLDATVPFLRRTAGKRVLNVDVGRAGKRALKNLTMRVIGLVERKRKSHESKELALILKRLILGR